MSDYNPFFWITIFALSAAIINSIGIWVIYKHKKWVENAKNYLMCFAAGLLISSPLLHAFPEAVEKTEYAGYAALAGFLFMYFSNQIIKYKTKQKEIAFGITAIQGIGIHSFIDGIIYSVTFSVSITVGLLAGVGLVIHEFAEGVIAFSVLLKGGLADKKALYFAFIIAGLTTPVGAFMAYPMVSQLRGDILGLALGFVVGVLIYVSAAHLLPEAREHEKEHSPLAFIAGIALALLLVIINH